ncbi:MAG: hypothetical protein QOH25_978 [Acidobacteriota bacterium]|nr:hypothetical protein [Acidobacteriota bacterium]
MASESERFACPLLIKCNLSLPVSSEIQVVSTFVDMQCLRMWTQNPINFVRSSIFATFLASFIGGTVIADL